MLKLSSIHALCSAATISFAHASLRAALLGCLCISASVSAAPIVTEFALLTATAQPRGIVTGADGNIWLTQIAGGKIGRMTTAGALTEFIPLRGGVPLWTVMPDGTWTGNLCRRDVQRNGIALGRHYLRSKAKGGHRSGHN